jgi:hypothetical protein
VEERYRRIMVTPKIIDPAKAAVPSGMAFITRNGVTAMESTTPMP